MTARTRKSAVQRMLEKQKQIRQNAFGDIDERKVWHRKRNDGFTTIPRTMPLIGAIMDGLAGKGKPVATTYLELWARSNDDGFLTLNKPNEVAFASGFTGQRGVGTWKERVRRLEALGFLETKPGVSGNLHYVQIWNPYHVILKHKEKKTEGFRLDQYNALFERAIDIGAKDILEYEAAKKSDEESNS